MGSKRQLPPWMLRAAATDQLSTSVSKVRRKASSLKELPTEACHKSSVEAEQNAAEVTACQSEITQTDLCLAKKSKTTRIRRKQVKRADEDDDDISNIHERDVEKENNAPPKRKRKAKVLKATKTNAVEESTLSEDELSVDDLISIAKEFTNAEKRKEGQRSSFTDYKSESLPQSISSKDKTTHEDNIPSIESILNAEKRKEGQRSSFTDYKSKSLPQSISSKDKTTHEDNIPSIESILNAEKRKEDQRSSFTDYKSESLPQSISSEDKTTHEDYIPSIESILNVNTLEASPPDLELQPSEVGAIVFSETGNVVQDFLDLFLGPSLKKSTEVKPNPEPVSESEKLDYPSSNEAQDGLIGEAIPLARKKGSLKDKVVLLLDSA